MMDVIERNKPWPSDFELLIGDGFQIDGAKVRLIDRGDEARIVDFYYHNRDFLKPWEPSRDDEFYTLQGWMGRIERLHRMHELKASFSFAIFTPDESRIIGTLSFTNMIGFPMHGCHLGYALAEDRQGQGLMHQAIKVCTQWLFEEHSIHRVMAAYLPRNVKSEKVLSNLGFEFEGKARNYLLINGQWEDHNLMALMNPAWDQVS